MLLKKIHPGDGRVHTGEMQQRVQDGFSTLLPTADAVRIFEQSLKLSRIAAAPQKN